jgi:hypothetical protein
MRFDTISARIRELEEADGYETLSDGSRYRFKFSGILIFCKAAKHRRETGKEATLADFTEEEQREIVAYAKWTPDSNLHGQLAVITCKLAREIVARS